MSERFKIGDLVKSGQGKIGIVEEMGNDSLHGSYVMARWLLEYGHSQTISTNKMNIKRFATFRLASHKLTLINREYINDATLAFFEK